MLGKPDAGWTCFQLGSEETQYNLSYLNDVAYEWLDQAIHGLKTMGIFSVHGFCEPRRMICTISYWSCYVIFEDEDREPACYGVTHLHVSMLEFCKQLHEDITNNLEEWVHWNDIELLDPDDEEKYDEVAVTNRRNGLKQRLYELKQWIEQREELFGENNLFI